MAHASVDVLIWIVNVADIMETGGLRHELHQSLRPLRGTSARVEIGFGLDDRPNQVRIHAVTIGGRTDNLLDTARRQPQSGQTAPPLPDDRPVAGLARDVREMEHSLSILVNVHVGPGRRTN